MEATSTEVMQDANPPHESDDPTSAAADAIGEDLVTKAKAEYLEPGANVKSSIPDLGGDTIEIGESSQLHNVQPVTQPRECMGEIQQGVVQGGSAVPVDPLQTITDRVLEHSSDSGSKAKFVYGLNQGSNSVGRQRRRKHRASGFAKVPETRSSPSQLVKPNDDSADQSFEDNENRSSTKENMKKTPVPTFVYYDNDPSSTTRRQPHRGDEERSLGTPARRLAFTPLQPSELNIRMGTTTNQTPEKYTPTKAVATSKGAPTVSVEEELPSPILSLQQAGSITAQVLTIGDESDNIESEGTLSAPVEDLSDEGDTIESALGKTYMQRYGPDDSSEHHDSDKENVPVHEMFLPGPGNLTLKFPRGFNTVGSCTREPLQTLYSAPSPSMYQSPDIFTTPAASPQQLFRARYKVEAGRQWLMVVDTNCILNEDSLKSLKQLEGIRETRLVIPIIVVRELDNLQRQENWKASACSALQWIETCMLKLPSWIHVQNSADTVHVAMTPPISPSIYSRGFHSYVGESDIMHPTFHDHVLECALFQQRVPDGRVAILTDDTTLKIKALAEGLVVDTAINFSDSLLNPYSDRFIYAGSTPIGRSSSRLYERLYDGPSTPRSTISSLKWPAPDVRPMSRPGTPRPTSRANFSIWRKSQPIGLQALLA